MKSLISKISCVAVSILVGSVFCLSHSVFAEEEEKTDVASDIVKAATSISISPVSKVLQLEPDKVYSDTFDVTNNGTEQMKFEVYASPYSYTLSEADNEYKLGFSRESKYTQITRWITFKDTNGAYVKQPKYVAEPGQTVTVKYHISTPSSIPAGGQYAVLFAHTLSEDTGASGIKTEASPGLVVYGRSTGETISTSEISDLKIERVVGEVAKNNGTASTPIKDGSISASAKVKNTGNVDFMAYGTLKVTGLFGQTVYETPATQGRISVIPESELTVSDTWEEVPYFGIFNASWTVHSIDGEETINTTFVIMPLPIILLVILLLTIITVWIIIAIRKRKEHKSRYSM